MISKIDLIKEFELLTRQQIKEHNDLLLSTNVRLQKIEFSIESILIKIDRLNAARGEEKLKDWLELVKFKNSVEEALKLIKSNVNDSKHEFDILGASQNEMLAKFSDEFNEFKAGLLDKLKLVKSDQKETDRKALSFSDQVVATMTTLVNNQKAVNDALKREIDDLAKSVEANDKILKKKEEINTESVKGYLRELDVSKKAIFILEKKVENIYTAIERLKSK